MRLILKKTRVEPEVSKMKFDANVHSMDIDEKEKVELERIENMTTELSNLLDKNSSTEKILAALNLVEVKCSSTIINDIIRIMKGNLKESGMNDILTGLKDILKCPYCGDKLKRLRGRPIEVLKCETHNCISKFALASQIPKVLLKEYLEKLNLKQRHEWIQYINDNIKTSEQKIGSSLIDVKKDDISENTMEEDKTKSVDKNEINTNNDNCNNDKEFKNTKKFEENERNKITENKRELDSHCYSTLEMLTKGKPLEEVIYLLVSTVGKIADKLNIFNHQNAVEKKHKLETDVENNIVDKSDVGPQKYLKAAMKGKNSQQVTTNDVRKICSYTYSERIIDRYNTIHMRGIRRSRYKDVWKVLIALGVDRRRVKWLTFVNNDTLEIDISESYVDEFVRILETAHTKDGMKDLIVKKINFEALDESNIKNKKINLTASEIFDRRLSKKCETIEGLLPKAPHLRRLLKYVKLQKENRSFDIPMNRGSRYDPTVADVIVEKLNDQIKTRTVEAGKSLVTVENINQTKKIDTIIEENNMIISEKDSEEQNVEMEVFMEEDKIINEQH